MATVIIVGAGPAGASLAYLLARNGVDVTLVERRQDFAREFRGEILMPSGVDAFAQMGLLDDIATIPHHTLSSINVFLGERQILAQALDPGVLQGLSLKAISQPALLEMLIERCSAYSNFELLRGAVLRELLYEGGRVSGVRVGANDEDRNIAADLVIGADGRNSMVRRKMGVAVREINPPMDIVWCKLPLPHDWPGVRAFAGRGHLMVAYHTWGDELQMGWVILKGTFGALRERGIEQWVAEMTNHVPEDFAEHLRQNSASVQKPFLLNVASECVEQWSQPGVLLIGDAAHTMSPVGGQGINIALRDALVTANQLVGVLSGTGSEVCAAELDAAAARVEEERMPEVASIQNMQALPPKLMLSRAWWGEPLRRLAAGLLTRKHVRLLALPRVEAFLYGVTEVELHV